MAVVNILQLPDSAEGQTPGSQFPPPPHRQVQVLLWDYVKNLLKEAEEEAVKQALGRAAIEENEQLFREAASLEEILGDLQLGAEKQAEVQKLFETPARSMVEDEIRLLLEAIHRSSSQGADTPIPDIRFQNTPPRESQDDNGLEESDSASESFYEVPVRKPAPNPRGLETASSETRFPPPRDCHSAPMPLKSAKDRQIFEYLTARPATSGSLRPRTSDLRPSTAFISRPDTSGGLGLSGGLSLTGGLAPTTLRRPQTAAVRLDWAGRFHPTSPQWESFTPPQESQNGASLRFALSPTCDAETWKGTETEGSVAIPRSIEDWHRASSLRPSSQWGRSSLDRKEGSRPGTASSTGGREPSMVLGEIADRLNVFQIDVVAAPLQRALADERAALLEDIDYLHQLIDYEADASHKASRPPPSVKDLRDCSARLEAALRTHVEIDPRREMETRSLRSPGTFSSRGQTAYSARLKSPQSRLERPQELPVLQIDSAQPSESCREVVSFKGNALEKVGLRSKGDISLLGAGRGLEAAEVIKKGTAGVLLSPVKLKDDFDECDQSGAKRTSSSKVRRLRSQVLDSQTEASGAASLCRAQIT